MQREDIVELTKTEESPNGIVRYFLWNGREYNVQNSPCFSDDGKTLMRAIMQQAINDYVKLADKEITREDDKLNYETAYGLLFNDNYTIDFGGIDITLKDMVSFITGTEPNMEMLRDGIKRMLENHDNPQFDRVTEPSKSDQDDDW